MSLLLFANENLPSTEVVDRVRLTLEATSASWFRIVKWSGYAVAGGCALEIQETWLSLKHWWLLRHRGIEHEETQGEKRSLMKPAAAFGLLLIVLGIVLETYGEGKVSDIDAALRGHESDKITATENATAQANVKVAQLEKERAALSKQAEDERLARLTLEAQVNPRRLTPDQEKRIAAALRNLEGRRVGVATYTQDPEAAILAIQIIDSLGMAGILVDDRIGTFGAMGTPLYLGVVVDTNTPDKSAQAALFNALARKGTGLEVHNISFAVGEGSSMYVPKGTAQEDAFIFVGSKPVTTSKNKTKTSP